MTMRQNAEQLYSASRNLCEADAITLIETMLQHTFIKGEKSGIESARQSIGRLGDPTHEACSDVREWQERRRA